MKIVITYNDGKTGGYICGKELGIDILKIIKKHKEELNIKEIEVN